MNYAKQMVYIFIALVFVTPNVDSENSKKTLAEIISQLSIQYKFQYSYEILETEQLTMKKFINQKINMPDKIFENRLQALHQVQINAVIPFQIVNSLDNQDMYYIIDSVLSRVKNYCMDQEISLHKSQLNRDQLNLDLAERGFDLCTSWAYVIGSENSAKDQKKVISVKKDSIMIRDLLSRFVTDSEYYGGHVCYSTTDERTFKTHVFLANYP